MKTNKLIMLLAISLAIPTLIGCNKNNANSCSCAPVSCDVPNSSSEEENNTSNSSSNSLTANDTKTIILNKDNQLDGGEITKDNLTLHFDENSVLEHPSNCFIEIGPYGSLYLENYIQGIGRVYAKAVIGTDYLAEFYMGTGATPNCVDEATIYTSTDTMVDLSPDKPYFSIHNRAGNKLLIDRIEITYKEPKEDLEPLRNKIKVSDKYAHYDINSPVDPYLGQEVDLKDIPENRIVKKINEGQKYVKPGKYTFGYEVYNKNKDGTPKKMLYSSIAELTIEGNRLGNKHLAIFHKPNEDVVLEVANHQKVDFSGSYSIKEYNWDSPINDFETPFYGDRHYYPVFNVVGMPSNKDGDGCYPVYTTYTMLEKSFDMPEPTMMEGYKFAGWYLDHELTKIYDPNAEYVGDITLYAKCVETDKNFKKVYYHDYDGKFLDKVDLLYEGNSIPLPKFEDIGTSLNIKELMYEVRMGTNRIGMLIPEHDFDRIGHYNGDRLSYDMVKEYDGDVHLYVSKFELYYDGPMEFTRIFQDSENNAVISGYRMPETNVVGDFVLTGRYVHLNKSTWQYDLSIYSDPARSDEFLVTDEVHGYIVDQGSFNSICSYGYGNKRYEHSKPLQGILRHDSVLRVGRRAFFNRYGLVGTYFPKNAMEFDVESYANTTFNDVLLLPKNLQKIGPRAFMGSKNIKYVALPKSLRSVGKGAFSLGTYDENTYSFKDIKYRINYTDQIIFYYEGSEEDFNRLDENTLKEINNNALKVVFNYKYNPRYGR